jgi:hypothetical protein
MLIRDAVPFNSPAGHDDMTFEVIVRTTARR